MEKLRSALREQQEQNEADESQEDSEEEDDDEYEHLRYRVGLDTKGQLELRWDIDPPLEKIRFRLIADVTKDDIVGFGFSDYGEAENADLAVLWTDTKGHHRFQVSSNLTGVIWV